LVKNFRFDNIETRKLGLTILGTTTKQSLGDMKADEEPNKLQVQYAQLGAIRIEV